jgi:RimJ/RimL family protein N-acetyltransferase
MMLPQLHTPRLILRPFTLADAPDVRCLAGDRAIADTTLNVPHPYGEGMAEAWIATHAEAFASGQRASFAITRRSDNALLGAISLMTIQSEHQAELGYWVGKPYWSQGYCTEAARAIVQYAFDELKLIRVHACHLSRNPASGAVMRKLGMQHEGRRRLHARKWDRFEDMELYGLLASDWRARLNQVAAQNEARIMEVGRRNGHQRD